MQDGVTLPLHYLRKLCWPLTALIFIAVMGYSTYEAWGVPYCNWDMLGYVGAVVLWDTQDPTELYRRVMESAATVAPDWVMQQYRDNILSSKPEIFIQHLPLYTVKPFYNVLMWLQHQFGVDLSAASAYVAAMSFALTAALAFIWKPRYMARSAWLIMVLLLTFAFPWPMRHLAQLSTPDGLATLLTPAMLVAWLQFRSLPAFFIIGFLAQLSRPETLILSTGFTLYFAFMAPAHYRINIRAALGYVAFLIVTYLVVSRLGGNWGLERWFIYAFIDKTPYPAQATSRLSLEQYWNVLYPSVIDFVKFPRTAVMLAFSAFACLCHWLRPGEGGRQCYLLMLICWAGLVVRFLMFPSWGDHRYYFVYYLPILFFGGEMIAPYLMAWRQILREHAAKVRSLPLN